MVSKKSQLGTFLNSLIKTVNLNLQDNEYFLLTVQGKPWTHYVCNDETMKYFEDNPQTYYMGVSTYRLDENGKLRRRKKDVATPFMIVFDDIGTKGASPIFKSLLDKPSFKMTTSPGNQQWGYLLSDASSDPDYIRRYNAVTKTLASVYGDASSHGTYRIVRAPGSLNQKPENDNFASKSNVVNLKRTFTLAEIEAYTATLTPKSHDESAQVTHSEAAGGVLGLVDPMHEVLQASGLLLPQHNTDGWTGVQCPRGHFHSDSSQQGAGLSMLHQGEILDQRVFHCFHEHCSDLTTEHYLHWVEGSTGIAFSPDGRQEIVSAAMAPISEAEADTLIHVPMTAELVLPHYIPHPMVMNYFPVRATSILVAMGGIGKTTFIMLESIMALHRDSQAQILIMSAEDEPSHYAVKMRNLLLAENALGERYLGLTDADIKSIWGRIIVINTRGTGMKWSTGQLGGSIIPDQVLAEKFINMLKMRYPKVIAVFWETYSRFAQGETNEQAEAAISTLDLIGQETDTAHIVSQHTGKTQARDKMIDLYSGRGASTLGDNTRSALVMTRLDPDQKNIEVADLEGITVEDVEKGNIVVLDHVRSSYSIKRLTRIFHFTRGAANPNESTGYGTTMLEVPYVRTSKEEKKSRQMKAEIATAAELSRRVLSHVQQEEKVEKRSLRREGMALLAASSTDIEQAIKDLIDDGELIEIKDFARFGDRKKYLVLGGN